MPTDLSVLSPDLPLGYFRTPPNPGHVQLGFHSDNKGGGQVRGPTIKRCARTAPQRQIRAQPAPPSGSPALGINLLPPSYPELELQPVLKAQAGPSAAVCRCTVRTHVRGWLGFGYARAPPRFRGFSVLTAHCSLLTAHLPAQLREAFRRGFRRSETLSIVSF
jgi:hypothetical protein